MIARSTLFEEVAVARRSPHQVWYSFAIVIVAALLLVIPFTFSVRRRVAMAHETSASPVVGRMVALVSLSLWTIIALGGRWIGFP